MNVHVFTACSLLAAPGKRKLVGRLAYLGCSLVVSVVAGGWRVWLLVPYVCGAGEILFGVAVAAEQYLFLLLDTFGSGEVPAGREYLAGILIVCEEYLAGMGPAHSGTFNASRVAKTTEPDQHN